MAETRLLKASMLKATNFIKDRIVKELEEQGHRATGKLIDTIRVTFRMDGTKLVSEIFIEDYAFILDKGVIAANVPYRRGSGAGTSKYIDALIGWINVVKPGLSEVESKSFAFAIANKAKQVGHPTTTSPHIPWSSNTRRTEWSKFAVDEGVLLQQFRDLLGLGPFVVAIYTNAVTQIQKLVAA